MADLWVLGIDAAWTEKNNSGVALVRLSSRDPAGKPEVVALGRSYGEFACAVRKGGSIRAGLPDWTAHAPELGSLDAALQAIADQGWVCSVAAVDMPLDLEKITKRREADQCVSRAFGKQHASTHSPGEDRPGQVGVATFRALMQAGFRHVTCQPSGFPPSEPALIETYPHPAIIRMLDLDERLPYKVSKRRAYGPAKDPNAQWQQLGVHLDQLREGLARRLGGLGLGVLPEARGLIATASPRERVLKGYEDALDALVCAWAGVEFWANRAQRFGDDSGAIWIPGRPEVEPCG